MYPNIQKAMTRNLKKSQKLVVFIGPVLFLYLFWWIWYSNGKVIDENNRGMLLLFAGMAVFLILSIPLGQWSQRKVMRRQFSRFSEAELERIDRFLETAEPIRGITVTPDALIGAGVMVVFDRRHRRQGGAQFVPRGPARALPAGGSGGRAGDHPAAAPAPAGAVCGPQ